MDQVEMVSCTAEDLRAISAAFKAAKIDVQAVYFIKRTSVEDHVEWLVQVVTTHSSLDFVHKLVELRRAGRLPDIDREIRISSLSPDDIEAQRVLDYARTMKSLPLTIRGVYWGGLYIEYALVAEVEGLKQRAA